MSIKHNHECEVWAGKSATKSNMKVMFFDAHLMPFSHLR